MVPAVRPSGPLSMARGYARIDSRPDTAKIGSADRVEVHHARLLAVIGVRKRFYTAWVKTGKAQCEQMFSALPERADIAQRSRHVRFVPFPDLGGCIRDVGKYSHDYSDGPASYNRNRWHLQLCAP
jgi:hypothetical protein